MSKRCCPVCAWLLRLLNKHYGTKFVITDQHSNITSCAISEFLPDDIIYLMVLEFSRRLRLELEKLQETTDVLRGRAGTSDSTRLSLDSNGPPEREGAVAEHAAEAFGHSIPMRRASSGSLGEGGS